MLLLSDATGTVSEIRAQRPSRRIQDFETETILRRLKEQGFIHKAEGPRGSRADCFTIPAEIAAALRGSVEVDDRAPLELISRAAAAPRANVAEEFPDGDAVAARIAALKDPRSRQSCERRSRTTAGSCRSRRGAARAAGTACTRPSGAPRSRRRGWARRASST